MFVEPYALLNEARGLAAAGVPDALDRLTIDPRCVVVTPAHRAANRLRERARGSAAHGTCGIGFGSAVNDSIYRPDLTITAAELADRRGVAVKLRASVRHKAVRLGKVLATADGLDAEALRRPDWIADAVELYAAAAASVRIDDVTRVVGRTPGPVVFEAAQGVLLDETFGFHPHTTWSTTTFANADRLLDEAGWAGERHRVGVVRSYFTRHGAGPFVTEDESLRAVLPEPHNDDRGHQGRFRVGPFDAVAAGYAVAVAGPVDELAVTHLDRLPSLPPRVCTAYETPDGRRLDTLPPGGALTPLLNRCRPVYEPIDTSDPAAFADRLGALLGTPVGLLSFGPAAADKREPRPQGGPPPTIARSAV